MTGEVDFRHATESVRPGDLDLESMSTPLLVGLMADDVTDVQRALVAATDQIATAIDRIAERLLAGGRLIYLGAGTSGRLAVMDAAECVPTFSIDAGRVLAVIAGGSAATESAVEEAEDSPDAAGQSLAALGLNAQDAVVGLSASGSTPFVLGGIVSARSAGALTVGVACNAQAPLSAISDVAIELLVGPEILAGSTRLKSGTAQKVVLNAISTFTMVRLGKTYRNLMVDVRPTNAKLRERSARIVGLVTGADAETVAHALTAAGGETKAAIVMLTKGVSVGAAQQHLEQSGGSLGAALGE